MDRVLAVNIRGIIMNKKFLLLAGVVSVLSMNGLTAVSYTHLTLPTICSV